MHIPAPFLLCLAALAACSSSNERIGHVVDVFDRPVADAEVTIQGVDQPVSTDAHGVFALPDAAQGKRRIRAGAEGYIYDEVEVELGEGKRPRVVLYPRVEETGFYLIDRSGYRKLEPEPVQAIGGVLDAVRGLKALGDVQAQARRIEVLFHTTLKLDQVMRVHLGLHSLEFTREAAITGPLDNRPVQVNLWTPTESIELELDPLRSKSDYVLRSTAPVEPGAYAFDAQRLLVSDHPERFARIPEALRVAYPFELR